MSTTLLAENTRRKIFTSNFLIEQRNFSANEDDPFSDFLLEQSICVDILNLLTEHCEDESLTEERINFYILDKKNIFISIIDNPNNRSDVRGYAAKLIIEKSEDSDRDSLIDRFMTYQKPLINFGILYGLEEIKDYSRIQNYFANDSNKRLRETAIEILKSQFIQVSSEISLNILKKKLVSDPKLINEILLPNFLFGEIEIKHFAENYSYITLDQISKIPIELDNTTIDAIHKIYQ